MPKNHRIQELEERFLRYAKIDSQSDEQSSTVPSTDIQWVILELLRDECIELELDDVVLTESGFVMATIPASAGCESSPTVAFLAHVDTAPAFAATNVKPVVHRGIRRRRHTLRRRRASVP